MTVNPLWASSPEIAAPMPEPAPVTTASWPAHALPLRARWCATGAAALLQLQVHLVGLLVYLDVDFVGDDDLTERDVLSDRLPAAQSTRADTGHQGGTERGSPVVDERS